MACAALLLVILIAGAIVLRLRRKLLEKPPPGESFGIAALEKLHEQGLVSDEEFSRLRRAAMGLPPLPPARGPGPAERA